jgi:hypothetical protein
MAKRIDELDAKASVATTDVVPCVTGTSPAEKATALQVAKSHDGDFGAQNVVTTGYVGAGSTVADQGSIRLASSSEGIVSVGSFGGSRMTWMRSVGGDLHIGGNHAGGNLVGNVTVWCGATHAIGLFGAIDAGGGERVLSIKNAATAPGSNPTGGGILFADGGAGKWHGSSGTITTFGTADPHCPTCGRDFAVEHQNPGLGEHIALCLPCLVDALKAAGVNTAPFTIKDERGATKADWDANHAAAKVREAEAEAERLSGVEAEVEQK